MRIPVLHDVYPRIHNVHQDIHDVYCVSFHDVRPDIHYCILTYMMSIRTCMVRIYSRNKMHYKLHVLHAVKEDNHDALIKTKIKFSSYISKFGREQFFLLTRRGFSYFLYIRSQRM